MRVLLLSPYPKRITSTLEATGDEWTADTTIWNRDLDNWDFIISYGHREIIPKWVLDIAPPAINLHISLLPWNRGADPNLWSWLDDTPKGVTIHWIDEGVDTGDVLSQKVVNMRALGYHTLQSTYTLLQREIEREFADLWPLIRKDKIIAWSQKDWGKGSYHTLADRACVQHLLTKGWNTPVRELIGLGKNIPEPKREQHHED